MTDLDRGKVEGEPGGSADDKEKNQCNHFNSNESVSIRLPTFWPNSIATWFVQVEAQFTIGRVQSEQKKYNYVVASLPQDVAESLMDVFENPPAENQYKNLKETLIQRHSLSIEKRIRKLVSDEEIGDRKPSEFYRHMKILAGTAANVGDEFVKKLWLSRLPNVIKIALIPQSDGDLETLLSTSDKIWEAMQNSNSVSAIHTAATSSSKAINRFEEDRFTRLENEIHSLKNMISSMNVNNHNSRSRSRENTEGQGRSNMRNRSNSNRRNFDRRGSLCWYHFKYGDQATKCVQPCRKNVASSSASNSNSQAPN